ncbi:hypothetical protein BH10PSE2_BH10PSE2_11620 [soil metagenome]
MASSRPLQPRPKRATRWPKVGPWVGLILTILSPFTVFLAMAGLKTGLWPIGVAYDVMTMQVAAGLALLGGIGALVAVLSGAFSFRQSWPAAIGAVLVSGATAALFYPVLSASGANSQSGQGVSTNAIDPPAFPATIVADRNAAGADALTSNPGPDGCAIQTLPIQVAPGVAAYGLQKAGFTVSRVSVGRGEGTYVSPWFDRAYDAVIRIRPAQTDVRVAPRDGAHDHGKSCRLAIKIIANLR